MSNPPSDLDQPDDVLIVGGGSARATCGRPVERGPNRRVLLLEAGPAFDSDEVRAATSTRFVVRDAVLRLGAGDLLLTP